METSWNSTELSAIVGGGHNLEARQCRPVPQKRSLKAFARDCVQLAAQADSPGLREKLLSMARESMRAALEEDEATPSTGRPVPRRRFRPPRGVA